MFLSVKNQINRLPGMDYIARKRENFWWINLYKKINSYKFFDEVEDLYFPKTFLIPDDFNDYVNTHSLNPSRTYISKSSRGKQGTGIKLLNTCLDLGVEKLGIRDDMVIQRYLDDPLIIDGKKHDLRLYLIILSVEPLIAYVNEEGLARFCTKNYKKPKKDDDFEDLSCHLTNYSLNKSSQDYKQSDQVTEDNTGSKRTLASYWKAVIRHGLDPKKVNLKIIVFY
jgi:Tubulin-tyrosine ligase family